MAVCYSRLPLKQTRRDLGLTKDILISKKSMFLALVLHSDCVKCENPRDAEWTRLRSSAVYLSHHEVDQ